MKLIKRVEIVDFIKGISIFLVVYGHAIQHTSGEEYLTKGIFFDNIIFKLIYSFHMPLFMLISGFLFQNYNIKDIKKNIMKKVEGLLYPIVFWQTLWSMRFFCNNLHENFLEFYIKQLLYEPWFLWAVFYSSLVIIMTEYFIESEKSRKIVYFFGVILSILLPDYLGSSVYKYMYPFFIIGYYNKKFIKHLEKVNIKYILYLISISIFYFFLFKYYNYSSYIYTTGYSIFKNSNINLNQILIDIYRFMIGLVGSISIIYLLNLIFKLNKYFNFNKIILLGRETLGIYIITGYMFSIIVKFPFIKNSNLNYMKSFLYSMILIISSLVIIKIIKTIKILSFFLLGNRK